MPDTKEQRGALADADRATHEPSPAVSALRVSVPSAETLRALAARCAAATGLDEALDADIFIALHDGEAPEGILRLAARTRQYTASMDAAMQLVPEECVWNLAVYGDGSAGADCAEFIQTADYPENLAATPALALAAAALRALAQAIEAGTVKTEGLEPKAESAVGNADAPADSLTRATGKSHE